MKKSEFDVLRNALRISVEEVFASLYLIDVGSLTPAERALHQRALNDAYIAMIRLENARFAAIAERARQKLAALAPRAHALREALAGLKRASAVLAIVAEALDILGGIARLVK